MAHALEIKDVEHRSHNFRYGNGVNQDGADSDLLGVELWLRMGVGSGYMKVSGRVDAAERPDHGPVSGTTATRSTCWTKKKKKNDLLKLIQTGRPRLKRQARLTSTRAPRQQPG